MKQTAASDCGDLHQKDGQSKYKNSIQTYIPSTGKRLNNMK